MYWADDLVLAFGGVVLVIAVAAFALLSAWEKSPRQPREG
jgi:hypothetical protein